MLFESQKIKLIIGGDSCQSIHYVGMWRIKTTSGVSSGAGEKGWETGTDWHG